MLSQILSIIANSHHPYKTRQDWPDGGNLSTYSVCGDLEEADWSEIEVQASAKGIEVSHSNGQVYMQKGRSIGRFATNVAGLKIAQQFLEGVR